MRISWWSGPLPPGVDRLNRDQQLVLHCWFTFARDADEVIAAVSDFPSYLRRQLDDLLARPRTEMSRQLLAAGLLTYGHLEMVEVILNNMPPGLSPAEATGYCVAAPSNILSRLLPLPSALKTSGVHGVIDAVRVREWFEMHRSELTWNAADGQFHLVAKS